jgi:hypothetical protein
MNTRRGLLVVSCLVISLSIAAADEAMTDWQWMFDLTTPASPAELCQITLSNEVLGATRQDLADLRLLDARGREIPFAARVRREIEEARRIETRKFNSATAQGNVSEITVDIGESGGTHNEVEIESAGRNFRRQVELDGSDDGRSWRVLKTDGKIFRFESNNNRVESTRVDYPVSRYRYLRARVSADSTVDKDAPEITSIAVMMSVRDKGESVSWSITVPSPDLVRSSGGPGTQWKIDFGQQVPCNRLILETSDASFSRYFTVEQADDPQDQRLVASGEIKRRSDEAQKPVEIVFDEVYARRLNLTLTDFANPPLGITSIRCSAAARQVLFDVTGSSPPFRLFTGNPKAEAPRYDFENEVASRPLVTVARVDVGGRLSNPNYRPEPKPLTERVPWLIYAVLGLSSLALGLILLSLIRSARRAQVAEAEVEEMRR